MVVLEAVGQGVTVRVRHDRAGAQRVFERVADGVAVGVAAAIGRVPGVEAVGEFPIVGHAVAIAVGGSGVGLRPGLAGVLAAVAIGVAGDLTIAIGVLRAVGDAVAVAVGVQGADGAVVVHVHSPGRLDAVLNAVIVAVRIEGVGAEGDLVAIAGLVAVRVGVQRIGAVYIQLVAVEEQVGVGVGALGVGVLLILAQVGEVVAVGVVADVVCGRIEPVLHLPPVGHAVAVAVG